MKTYSLSKQGFLRLRRRLILIMGIVAVFAIGLALWTGIEHMRINWLFFLPFRSTGHSGLWNKPSPLNQTAASNLGVSQD